MKTENECWKIITFCIKKRDSVLDWGGINWNLVFDV